MTGLVEDPLFYRMIGQQIGNNKASEAREGLANKKAMLSKQVADKFEAVAYKAVERIEVQNAEIENLNSTVEALRNDVAFLDQSDFNYECTVAGVRGVVRELLSELRVADPNHPLLDKGTRDKVFDQAKNVQVNRSTGIDFRDRNDKISDNRDLAFGAKDASKSGPEKSQITSNKAVRQAAGVPDHISDREKLLGLVAALTQELHEAKPNAKILEGKKMRDTFEEFMLNENKDAE